MDNRLWDLMTILAGVAVGLLTLSLVVATLLMFYVRTLPRWRFDGVKRATVIAQFIQLVFMTGLFWWLWLWMRNQ